MFWRTIRKFIPNRQAIAEVNTRLERVVIANVSLSADAFTTRVYAKKKLKLPAFNLPPKMNPLDFCAAFDLNAFAVPHNQSECVKTLANHLGDRFARQGLKNSKILVLAALPEKIDQGCIICYEKHEFLVLIPCCV